MCDNDVGNFHKEGVLLKMAPPFNDICYKLCRFLETSSNLASSAD